MFPAWTNTWGSEVNDLEDFPSGTARGEKSDIIWDTCLQTLLEDRSPRNRRLASVGRLRPTLLPGFRWTWLRSLSWHPGAS